MSDTFGLGAALTYTSPSNLGSLSAGAVGFQFTFATARRHVILCVTDTASSPIVFKVNSTTCVLATGDYDYFLMPGDCISLPDGILYNSICAASASNATAGTHFNIRGCA